MILTCEECHTRYLLPSGLLGPEGRRVRCSHCHHEWYQEPPEHDHGADPADLEPIPESVKPVPEGSSVPVIQIADEGGEGAAAPKSGGYGGYVAAAVILLLLLGIGYVLRGPVSATWPQSMAVYDLADAAPALPGEGLVIDRLRAEVVSESSGLNVLKVNGYVINLTDTARPVPPIRATLRRAGEEEIDSWLLNPEQDTLGPGEEIAFVTTYPTPPSDAKEVNIRFEPFATVKQVAADGEVTVTPEPAHETPGHDAAAAQDAENPHAPPTHH